METDSVSLQIFKYAYINICDSVCLCSICMSIFENVAASFKFCSSSRTCQFLLPNVFIPVQKPTEQKVTAVYIFLLWTYIMMISSVKAVPNQRVKKHNLKKGQMKKDKVFPPVENINNVWTNKQQRQNRERALLWGLCSAMGCVYERSGFSFESLRPAAGDGSVIASSVTILSVGLRSVLFLQDRPF